MRIGLDGQPLRGGMVNVGVGVIHTKPEGENTLVIVDSDTREEIHIPLRDEAMIKLYEDWFGKPAVLTATPGEMKNVISKVNGSKIIGAG